MSDTPPEPPPAGPSVGPLALEAALLLDVVADRLTSIKDGAAPKGATADDSGQHSATAGAMPTDQRCPECGSVPGASCTACPLCRFMSLLRGERPEATARLVDGALMIIRTLRSLVPDSPDAASHGPADHGSATGQQGGGQQGGGQQGAGQQGAGQQHPGHANPGRHGGLEHIDIL